MPPSSRDKDSLSRILIKDFHLSAGGRVPRLEARNVIYKIIDRFIVFAFLNDVQSLHKSLITVRREQHPEFDSFQDSVPGRGTKRVDMDCGS
jgi:hypothetical protein